MRFRVPFLKRKSKRRRRRFCIKLVLSSLVLVLVATSLRRLYAASAGGDSHALLSSSRLIPPVFRNLWKIRHSASWSSLLTVDPSKIISTLVKHGGLLIPDYIEKDLDSLAQVCHVEEASLNVVNRQLELVNFTVSLSGDSQENAALRIGLVHIEWDSYLQPCVCIQVQQVEVLLEFTNILLTRNNWHELNDAGFPPRLLMECGNEIDAPSSTFIRIGSVEFEGNVVVRIQSRPLDHKPLSNEILIDLATLKEFTSDIRALAESKRSQKYERPGCTTEEVYDMTVSWFTKKMQRALEKILINVATAPEGSLKSIGGRVQQHRKILSIKARDFLKDYTKSAGNKFLKDYQGFFSTYKDILPTETLDRVEHLSHEELDRVAVGSMFNDNLKKAASTDKPIRVDKDTHVFPSDVVFPDL